MNVGCKRAFDVTMAIIGLVLASPLMLIISALLWMESPGKTLFEQRRLGLHGQRFNLYKFRKFPSDIGNQGRGVTVFGDARMTPLGRLLERSKLDELPQLWNILIGNMSFVGPRPESERFADLFVGEFVRVLDYVPGIFGPNQEEYRNEADMYPPDESPEVYYRRVLFPAKAINDLAYFGSANCLTDISWIIRGVWACVAGAVNWKRLAGLHMRIVSIDIALVGVSWVLLYGIQYLIDPGLANKEVLWSGLSIVPLMIVMSLYVGGCYAHPVRSFSMSDALRLVIVLSIGWLVSFLVMLDVMGGRGIEIYLSPVGWLIMLPLTLLPRVSRRLMWERVLGESFH